MVPEIHTSSVRRPSAARRSSDAVAPLVLLDPSASPPLYRQLYEELRRAIGDGRLRAGARLPAARTMARELDLSRNTVDQAYEQLHAEGYLERHPRRGTFVARQTPELELRGPRLVGDGGLRRAPTSRALSIRGSAIAAVTIPAGVNTAAPPRAFRPGVPAVDAFPVALWTRLSACHWRTVGRRHLTYGHSAGHPLLRQAIAEHLRTTRAVRCTPDHVVITGGSQQGLALAVRLLLDAGETVWLEDPGYIGARAALIAGESRIVPVPVDDEGLDVTLGERLAPDARMAVVTPSHQHPLGVTMSVERRLALLGWAQRADAWIVEDDYDGELLYHGRPLPALQGLDRDDRVIYLGTFSKTLFPALRLGYAVVPPALAEAFALGRLIADRHSSVAEQAVLAAFIAGGHYARHVRRMRALYAARQNALLEALTPFADILEPAPARSGLNVLAWLPPGVDDREIARLAADAGIEVMPLAPFAQLPTARGALILGFGGYDEATLRAAAARLGEVVRGGVEARRRRASRGA